MTENQIETISENMPELRAEVLVTELLLSGKLNPEGILFSPKGLLHRALTSDVESLSKIYIPGQTAHIAQVEVNREGFYEMLPEALLHTAWEPQEKDTTSDVLFRAKRYEQEKADARTFFMPFEQAFYRLRMQLEDWETSNYIGWLGAGHRSALAEFWALPDWLSPRQTLLACLVLPCLHRLTGNYEQAGAVMQAMLGGQVEIMPIEEGGSDTGVDIPFLGEAQIGVDFVMGERSAEKFSVIQVLLSDWSANRLGRYLSGGRDALLIPWLCSYLFPAGLFVKIEIEIMDDDAGFSIGNDQGHGILGYSTKI